jgi:hypothetical protein
LPYRAAVPYVVAHGAMIRCSQGNAPATLVVMRRVAQSGPPTATVVDRTPSSIATFALCQSMQNPQVIAATAAAGAPTPVPCNPMIAGDWEPGARNVTVANPPKGRLRALTADSTCRCAMGGVNDIMEPMTRIKAD